ncbi:MAG: rRNA pseudouridine synthase [Flexistipes sinusarabici]|uniref:Pseudouridine synthase n=1 Tax=Flexistipes sinusarabici TaxID=2352 RepID=A0A5D0MY77_FLESI|nr:pseudouridine synthase [Flexistipes sinusarabici]TYB36991.1 MAG: rRNA pseudouridine synthase [Flexistipes sinusarabici]
MAGIKTELTKVRLNKFLASNTSLSRRKADEAIFSHRVRLNGTIISSPATYVDSNNDEVMLDNRLIASKTKEYLAFYKPKAVLTSYKREKEKRCLSDFDELKRKKPAYSGRLDYNSEGLILFSNDGYFIQKLQKPKNKIPKEYLVYTDENLSETDIKLLEKGITFNVINYMPCKISKLADRKYRIVLYEGKNRQIRNMIDYCGKKTRRLIRTKIGSVELKGLNPGEFRQLTKNEIMEIANV